MKQPKIIPRGKWILVRPETAESRENEHGLIMPSNVEQEQKAQGIVEAVGKAITDIEVGAQVIYGAYAGEVIKIREGLKEVELKLLHDDDIIAFLK